MQILDIFWSDSGLLRQVRELMSLNDQFRPHEFEGIMYLPHWILLVLQWNVAANLHCFSMSWSCTAFLKFCHCNRVLCYTAITPKNDMYYRQYATGPDVIAP